MELNTSVINISLWYNVKEGNQCGRELTLSSSSLSHSTAHVHFRRRSCAVMRIWCARGQLRKQIQRKRLKALYLINPLHPNISVHFLHNFFHTFPMVQTRSIWFKTKNPLVDDQCLFYGWCWWEILVTNHSQGLITYKGVCPTIVDRIRARRNCCNGRGQFFWVSFLVTRCLNVMFQQLLTDLQKSVTMNLMHWYALFW